MNRIWLLCLLLALFAAVSCFPSISYQQQLRNLQRSYPNQAFPVERARRLLYNFPRPFDGIDFSDPSDLHSPRVYL